MAKGSFSVTFKSSVDIVQSKVADALGRAADELKGEAVEWVQEKMLYGYNDPHGSDGHTEIYWTDRQGGTHMIDDIHANAKRTSEDSYTVEVGTNKDYAVFVHNGTRKLKARPFLRDALIEHIDDIEKIVTKYAENA